MILECLFFILAFSTETAVPLPGNIGSSINIFTYNPM